MKLLSNNFKHLDEIPNAYTSRGDNFSPSLAWFDYSSDVKAFLIVMVNLTTNKIYWASLVQPDKSFLAINAQGDVLLENNFGVRGYTGPNDIQDIVAYQINIYAVKDPDLPYESIMGEDNVLDKTYIKFIYNGYY